ncbi:ADP-ribosylglycohydrolase [Methanomicrobium sp. W14]|jgi:ADP-ribosylglycohydrolase|uniref:ADP-ribosylglycohydrolase family protein n=1 Tax=Methanomicrobium sp. W14 TaxID=2817839 RepID=UPI001AEA03A4|nr:ADP-ribosylglycohydrolase family protein [Methanomicrobium sp. W14]MBP2134307.1 ADP-ribosylglycohydrolase [Methanomicrobium sp. W14]
MKNEYRGAVLGAAAGDALGMPYETSPPAFGKSMTKGFKKAPRNHPNASLPAGGYTDDTQIMLACAELLVSGNFTPENYASKLQRLHENKKLRFPDGTVVTACRHMSSKKENFGCNSTTSGCIPLGLPFALAFHDIVEMSEKLVEACAVTHTNPGAHAAAISFATLIRATLDGDEKPLHEAQKNAFLEDHNLGLKTGEALRIAREDISLESSVSVIGNDVSVYQTLPMAYYLIQKFGDDPDLMYLAAGVGGNTDTIGFICGSWFGAQYGASAIDEDLILGLENRENLETIADRLYMRYGTKN